MVTNGSVNLQSGMALVLVEGEERIAKILETSNTSTAQPPSGTVAVSASPSQPITDTCRRTTTAFIAVLVILLTVLA